MFLHLDHHDAVYAERRRHDELAAARWRSARDVRRPAAPAATLGVLLARAGAVLTDDLLDGCDAREAALVEALVAQLVSAAAEHDTRLAVLAPRPGEPTVVAVRTLAALAQRGDARDAPVSPARAAAVRDLLHQLGAEPAGRRAVAGGATVAAGPPTADPSPAPGPGWPHPAASHDGGRSLSA